MQFFYTLFRPAIWVLNGTANRLLKLIFKVEPATESEIAHSEEELRHIVAESQRSKEVTETEKDILLNALGLNDRCVRDVMTPRNAVISLDIEDTFQSIGHVPYSINIHDILWWKDIWIRVLE